MSLIDLTKRIFKALFIGFALLCMLLLLISFTGIPSGIYQWLGNKNLEAIDSPEAIILLSGGGVPSQDGLYRVFCASEAAKQHPESKVIIALPGDTTSFNSSIYLTQQEMQLRGIDKNRLLVENQGTNTRSQAMEIAEKFPQFLEKEILIVTSPIHTRRAVLTFEKAGFAMVGSYPTYERIIEADLSFEDKELGGNKLMPELGKNINLRYRFWGHLKLEIDILRELTAMAYYKMKGWI